MTNDSDAYEIHRGDVYVDRHDHRWVATELLPGLVALVYTDGDSQDVANYEQVDGRFGPLTLVERDGKSITVAAEGGEPRA